MSRPIKKRNVNFNPEVTRFVPSGVPRCRMETVVFEADEIEALRLTDLEGLYQGQAAEVMGISRQTLGRILSGARQKASEALTMGKAMQIRVAKDDLLQAVCAGDSSGCSQGSGAGCGQEKSSGCGSSGSSSCGDDSGTKDGCRSGRNCSH